MIKKYCWGWCLLLMLGCSGAYYGAMEQFGVYKRDILVNRVEAARDSQTAAKKQFNSALEQFASVVAYQGADLEKKYKQLNTEYQKSQEVADKVKERIRAIEAVSKDLFKEWERELSQYSSPSLKADSQRQLNQTKSNYQALLVAMKKAAAKIPPVLTVFRDQVLYLKHNLNARAVSALKAEYRTIQSDVAQLVSEIEHSINEANLFINKISK